MCKLSGACVCVCVCFLREFKERQVLMENQAVLEMMAPMVTLAMQELAGYLDLVYVPCTEQYSVQYACTVDAIISS